MQNTKHLARLTGIRAVAALFVVFLHYRNDLETFLPSTKILDPLFSAGDLGVDLFFMLSGFILMLNYEQKFRRFALPEYRKFLWTRLARIYPVHVFTLFFLTALVLFARHLHQPLHHPEWYTLPAWLQNVFLLQAWTGIAQTLSWNFPAWSISAEWFCLSIFSSSRTGSVGDQTANFRRRGGAPAVPGRGRNPRRSSADTACVAARVLRVCGGMRALSGL
jgi:peptidoglycan/LPS O-acetylase OafA/YrhL